MSNPQEILLISPKYVGFWKRLYALIIDLVIAILLYNLVFFFTGAGSFLARVVGDHGIRLNFGFTSFHIPYVVLFLYIMGFWLWKSTSPGKMLISAEIVDAVSFEKPEHWQYLVRCLGYSLSAATLSLGFIWIAFDKNKRGLHDYLVGTAVVAIPKK